MHHPAHHGDVETDVAVVGGGITGLTAALLAKQDGRRVAVVEAGRVASGVTGYTTAKLTALHGLGYDDLARACRHEAALLYADANLAPSPRSPPWSGTALTAISNSGRRSPTRTTPPWWARSGPRWTLPGASGCRPPSPPTPPSLPHRRGHPPRRPGPAPSIGLGAAIPGDGSALYERTRALSLGEDGRCRLRTDRAPSPPTG